MSFLFKISDYINPQIIFCTNDIIFLIIISFYLGRIYQNYQYHTYPLKNNIHHQNGQQYQQHHSSNSNYISHQIQQSVLMNQQVIVQTKSALLAQQNYLSSDKKQKTTSPIAQMQLNSIKEQATQQKNTKKNQKNKSPYNQFQVIQHDYNEQSQILSKTTNRIKNSQKQNNFKNQKYNEFLLEKIKLDGQKIQQRGKFQLLFQKNKNNCNLIRKIQKHQIITDYLLKNQLSPSPYRQLIPLKKQSTLPNQNSVVQVQYYQNYQTSSPSLPIITKQIYQLTEKSQPTFNLFFQHGKFRKIYRSIQKIGEGAFGVVYQAYNMIQCKKYAIKKIFINKNTKQIQNLLNQIKILNNLSHPNIVNYNTCWLEYAQLNQHTSYQKLVQEMAKRKQEEANKKDALSIKLLQNYDDQQNSQKPQQQLQQSYQSQKNSGFSFIHSNRQSTKKSIKLLKNQNIKLALHNYHLQQQSLITNPISKSFGLLPVMYIQMQLCQHSLAYYLKKRSQIDQVFAFQIINQLIHSVSYLHINHVIHRDLKPQNILFVAHNGHICVKIGDFGLAINTASNQLNTQKFTINNTRVGTPSYIAPELYRESLKKLTQEDLQKADIYSLAVIYYQILNKFTTTHERGQKLSLLKQGKVIGLNQYKQQKQFIQDLIKQNRPKSKDIHKLQSFIKLNYVINHIKNNKYRSKQLSIQNNTIVNYQQCNNNINVQVQKILANKHENKKQKQNTKHKNKNKIKISNTNNQQIKSPSSSKINNSTNPQQLSNKLSSNQQNKQNTQQISKQNSNQISIQLYKANIELIKRVSQSQKNTDNKIVNKNKKIKPPKLTHQHIPINIHDSIFQEELNQSFQFYDQQNQQNRNQENKESNAIIK